MSSRTLLEILRLGACAFVALVVLPAQSLPTLVEIRQLPGPYGGASAGAPRMTASPDRRAFVVYGQGVEENPSGLFNTFAVIAPDGSVHGANALVPARVATVADDGTSFALGPRTASDPRIVLSKVDAAGDVPWSYTIDGCSSAMAVAANGDLLLAGSAGPGSEFAGVPAGSLNTVFCLAAVDSATGTKRWVRTLSVTRCGNTNCGFTGVPAIDGSAITVLPNGDIWVAGYTNGADLPVTSDAIVARREASGSWIGRFANDGTPRYVSYLLDRADSPIGIAATADGAVYVASRYTDFTKADTAARKLAYSTTEPWNIDQVGLGVDAAGRLLGAYGTFLTNAFWFDGDGFLGGAVAFPPSRLGNVTAAGDSLYGLMARPPVDPFDPLAQGFLYRWKVPDGAGPAVTTVVSAAGTALIERAAPGELVSFYGSGLGPAAGVSAVFDANGRLPVSLGGARVLFDGAAAPLLYASDGQINAIVPYGVHESTTVQVCTTSCAMPFALRVVAAHPNLFTAADSPFGTRAVAFDSDGFLNSSADPARPGSIVTVFVAGAGAPSSPLPDGGVGAPFQGMPARPVRVSLATSPGGAQPVDGQVLYAGSLAGTVNSVVQINARLPQFDAPAILKLRLTVTVGESPAVADIYVWNGGR